jgi:hypothetical protein
MTTTYNYNRSFTRQAAAEAFCRSLQQQGRAAAIWQGRDGFGQTLYIVKWN